MGNQTLLSTASSAAYLAIALVLWRRRDRGNIALPLALLFLDTFAWTFAESAYSLTGLREWHWLDHAFASWMPPLMVQVIASFVGRARALRRTLRGLYIAAAAIALLSAFGEWWWPLLLGHGLGSMGLCCALLLSHRRRVSDLVERRRTSTLLVAVLAGTLLSSTDLWVDRLPGVPRLSRVGMLLSLCLVAMCVTRLRLLGRDIPGPLVVYASVSAAALSAICLMLVRTLPSYAALASLLSLLLIAVGWGVWRGLIHSQTTAEERVQKLATLGRFSEQLAHDLRNPLAALKGAVQYLLVEREQGRSLDGQEAFLRLMLDQIERTSRVVEKYQRIASVEPLKASTSLNELVESVLGMQRFAPGRDVTVETRLEPSLPVCELDAELVTTTLENLLRNAYEAMPNGGRILVETAIARDHAGTTGVALTVIDDGQGMDARTLERANDRFFTTKAAGSGLGLAFVDRVARAHHGRLELSSETGRGTTVRLWMPLQGP